MNALVSFLSPSGLAIVIALVVMGLESWLTRPDPLGFITSLRQPSWALPRAVMYAIPFVFYGITTYAAAAAIRAGDPGSVALELVVAVLVGNAVLNHLLCRQRRIDWAFWFSLPLVAAASVATYLVFALEGVAGVLMALVVVFLIYDAVWLAGLAKLNPEHTERSTPHL